LAHVLIVDDEPALGAIVAALLHQRGHTSQWVGSGAAALEAVSARVPDLVLLDLHLGCMDGLEVLRRLRPAAPFIPIVMVTGDGSVQVAVDAMKQGATDFIVKPFDNLALLRTVEALLAMKRREGVPLLLGDSPAFLQAMELALRFAVPDINVLLLGETGTGKELFARAIHAASKRRNGPFVAVDCSVMPEGLIESELFGHERGAYTGATASRQGHLEAAQGGTLFLDEIGNWPLDYQAKFLRVLQSRKMERVGGRGSVSLDVRVVSATNVNLVEAIRAGRFRQDLYYRLQEITIELPPLRNREGDVRRIARHYVAAYAARFGCPVTGISEEALLLLDRHDWPGNVRELESVIKGAVVRARDVIGPEHLPPEIRGSAPAQPVLISKGLERVTHDEERVTVEVEFGIHAAHLDLKAVGAEAAEKVERSLLASLLRDRRLSRAQMAKLLGVDPKTLRSKLRRYGLKEALELED
jgi:DNA-binding NtrC family response regulator